MRKLKPTKPIHYPGYISPGGQFYACPHGAHIDLADWLVEEFCLSAPHPYSDTTEQDILEKLGWLQVDSSGCVYVHSQATITQKQMDTLAEFLTCEHHKEPPEEIRAWRVGDKFLNGTAESWVRNISNAIRYYSRDRIK